MISLNPRVMTPWERVTYVVLGIIVILAAVAMWYDDRQDHLRLEEEKAKAEVAGVRALTGEEYAQEVDQACRGRDAIAEELKNHNLCPEAAEITEQSELEPLEDLIPEVRDGIDGSDGTDGVDGVDGVDGQDGRPGRNGRNGDDGPPGPPGPPGPQGPAGPAGPAGSDGSPGRNGADGKDGSTPDLSGYATENWVLALIRALGCTTTPSGPGAPLVLTCEITGKP